MYATDFLFDGQRASDYGLMICSFDGEPQAAAGGAIERSVIQTPGRSRSIFCGAAPPSALEFTFSICKDPCQCESPYFTPYEEGRVCKWLLRTDGFKAFQIDEPGREDILYYVYVNLSARQIAGRTAGFDLTVTSDCAHGFTPAITKKATLIPGKALRVNVQSDVREFLLPRVKIKANGEGDGTSQTLTLQCLHAREGGSIESATLDRTVAISHVEAGNVIELDSDSDIFTIRPNTYFVREENGTLTERRRSPNGFNWQFPRLFDGANYFRMTGSKPGIDIEIQYQEPRRVIP